MILIFCAITLMIFFLILSFYFFIDEHKRSKKAKILKELVTHSVDRKGKSLYQKKTEYGKGLWKNLAGKIVDVSEVETVFVSLSMDISLEKFLIISIGFGCCLFIPAFVLSSRFLLSFLFFCAGTLIPTFYCLNLKKKRETILIKQLPDAIDMIVRSLRAGQSVDSALRDVSRGMPDPVGMEMTIVYNEIAMGLPFNAALRNFEKRYKSSADVKILCSAFVIQRESGGNLTDILDGLSHTIRERFALKVQTQAASSEERATALVLAMIPVAFAFITWIINPKYLSLLMNNSLGKTILFFAICLDISAFIVMRRITKIDI